MWAGRGADEEPGFDAGASHRLRASSSSIIGRRHATDARNATYDAELKSSASEESAELESSPPPPETGDGSAPLLSPSPGVRLEPPIRRLSAAALRTAANARDRTVAKIRLRSVAHLTEKAANSAYLGRCSMNATSPSSRSSVAAKVEGSRRRSVEATPAFWNARSNSSSSSNFSSFSPSASANLSSAARSSASRSRSSRKARPRSTTLSWFERNRSMEALAASAEAKRPSHVAAWRSSTSAWRRKRSSASVFFFASTDANHRWNWCVERAAEEDGGGAEEEASGPNGAREASGSPLDRVGVVAAEASPRTCAGRGGPPRRSRSRPPRRAASPTGGRSGPSRASRRGARRRCERKRGGGGAGEEGRDQGEREARTPRAGTEARRGARGGWRGRSRARARERRRDRARTRRSSRVPRLRARKAAEGGRVRGVRVPNPRVGDARRAVRAARSISHHIPRVRKSVHHLAPTRSRFRQERRRENITSSEGRVHSSSEPAPGPARVRRWRRIPSPRGYASRLVALDAAPGVLASPRAPRTKHAPRSTVSPPFHLPRSRRNASRRRTRRRTSAARSKSWTRRGASILVACATARLAPRALYSRIPPTTHARTSRRDTQGRQDRPGRARVGVPGAQAQDQEGTRARALTPSSRPFDRRSPHRRDPRLNPSPRSLLSSSRTSRT